MYQWLILCEYSFGQNMRGRRSTIRGMSTTDERKGEGFMNYFPIMQDVGTICRTALCSPSTGECLGVDCYQSPKLEYEVGVYNH